MLDQVLKLFAITPEHDLDIMAPNQHLHDVGAAVFARLAPVLAAEKPDWVLVQGDTTTVMAASLLVSLPTLIMFIAFQKQFVKGIALTGIKG